MQGHTKCTAGHLLAPLRPPLDAPQACEPHLGTCSKALLEGVRLGVRGLRRADGDRGGGERRRRRAVHTPVEASLVVLSGGRLVSLPAGDVQGRVWDRAGCCRCLLLHKGTRSGGNLLAFALAADLLDTCAEGMSGRHWGPLRGAAAGRRWKAPHGRTQSEGCGPPGVQLALAL